MNILNLEVGIRRALLAYAREANYHDPEGWVEDQLETARNIFQSALNDEMRVEFADKVNQNKAKVIMAFRALKAWATSQLQ